MIAFDKDVHKANALYIASADLVQEYPAINKRYQRGVRGWKAVWADQRQEGFKNAQAETTGVDIQAIRRWWIARTIAWSRSDDEIVKSQQTVADRFARLNLIPKPSEIFRTSSGNGRRARDRGKANARPPRQNDARG